MYTSIVLVALAGSPVAAMVPESLSWSSDYEVARKLGIRDRKPLAVFIGSGSQGWEQRSKEGKLSQDAKSLLATHYVCVYLDVDGEAGKRLARAFDMEAGLVLSDGTCENQAFRHAGALANADLERYLRKYADPQRAAERTDTHVSEQVRYYPSEPAPYVAPQFYTPGLQPSMFVPAARGGNC